MASLSLLALFLSSVSVTAVSHTPIKLASGFTAVRETANDFNNNTFRDGGVSTYVNGLHLQFFADGATCKSPDPFYTCGIGGGANTSSVSRNSLAYFGYLDPKDPSNLYQIGATGDVPNKHHFIMGIPGDGPGYFPLASNEAPLTGIWPNQALTLPGNKTALVDAAVVNNGLTVGYNALFVVDVVPPTSNDPVNKPLNITRVKSGAGNGLFYDGAVRYCDQGMLLDVQQDQIFCFGKSSSGIKMAAVDVEQYSNRSAYQFFNASSSTYSSTAPPYNDTASDIIATPSGLNTAYFYYSYYHGTYVGIIRDGSLYGISVTYSTNGKLNGKWSPLASLTSLPSDPGCAEYNAPPPGGLPYAIAAHPAWYGPGSNKLLISWSSCESYVSQATLTFA